MSSFSTKQKINRKSSTEADLIVLYNSMSKILWSGYLIEVQENNIVHNRLIQEKNIAILLKNDGKLSSSKWTKHINNRQLFVTDRVAHGDL